MTDVLPAALPGLREQGAAAGFPLAAPAPATDTGAILYAAPSAPTTETGAFPAPPAPVTDTGGFAYTTPATPVTDTGSFAYTTPPAPITDTGSFTYATPPQPALDTGAFAYAAPSTPATDTGAAPYAAPQPALDTGAFAYTAPPAPITGASPYAAPPAPAPVTGTGAFAHPIAPGTSPAPDPTAFPAGVPVPESPRALRAAKAIAFARAQVGKPCVWGAMGPGSYDCSSLTQAAWKAAGVVLPRAAHEQALAGSPVTTAGIEPGDLVLFFDDDRHVGLHIGGGMMVHAPGPGAIIREESIYGAGEAAIHRIVRPA
nr:C40 family peptidase [Streptomyces sp. TML10]